MNRLGVIVIAFGSLLCCGTTVTDGTGGASGGGGWHFACAIECGGDSEEGACSCFSVGSCPKVYAMDCASDICVCSVNNVEVGKCPAEAHAAESCDQMDCCYPFFEAHDGT